VENKPYSGDRWKENGEGWHVTGEPAELTEEQKKRDREFLDSLDMN